MSDNLVDKFLNKLQNHKLLATLIVVGIVIIAISNFTQSLSPLIDIFRSQKVKIVDVTLITDRIELENFKKRWKEVGISYNLLRFKPTYDQLIQDGTLDSTQFKIINGSVTVKEEYLSTGDFPVLDIKLLNEGGKTVFFKKLGVISQIIEYDTLNYNCQEVTPSSYNVLLSEKAIDTTFFDISQSIQSNEADRIAVVIGHPGRQQHKYLLKPFLVDQNEKKTTLGEYEVRMPIVCSGLGKKIPIRATK